MSLFSLTKKQGILIGVILIFIYLLPYILLGENSYITIFDFLDSNIAHIKAVFDNNALLDGNKIIPILSGLPRSLFFSTYDIKIIPFLFFSPYWAIVINTFLIKFTAFLGLYLLLDKHILKNGKNKNLINLGSSLCFALIPFYVDYGISSAGIPFVIYAFLNLYEKYKIWSSYFIIIYYGFYSSLVLSGLFLCIILFIYFIYIIIKEKQFEKYYLGGLCLLSLIYVGVNINLFISFLGSSNIIFHRSEFHNRMTLNSIIFNVWSIIKNSQYHAGSFSSLTIITLFIYIWFKYHKKNDKLTIYLLYIISIFGVIVLVYTLQWLFPNIEILNSFQFDRFYFLYPGLSFVILAICVEFLFDERSCIIGVFVITFILLSNLFRDVEFKHGIKSIISQNKNIINEPSYKNFYDENLFNIIEKSISTSERSNYKIVCVGLYPSILEYNGFHTLDGYFYQYPLFYKHKFRNIIEKELEKNPLLKKYYDDWGSRCYIFSSELGLNFMWGKEANGKVSNLEINTEALKDMNCSYIFSAVEIENYEQLNINPIGEYTTSTSYWKIYVYKI